MLSDRVSARQISRIRGDGPRARGGWGDWETGGSATSGDNKDGDLEISTVMSGYTKSMAGGVHGGKETAEAKTKKLGGERGSRHNDGVPER